MTQLANVGGMRWAEFDRRMERIVRRVAAGIKRDAADAVAGRVDIGARTKTSYAGVAGADVLTAADLKAQQTFVQLADKSLPKGVGMIGEENGFRRPSTLSPAVVLTIDPLDGTKKFVETINQGRELRPGMVSTMVGLLVEGQPVGGWICDVVTGVIYARQPYDSSTVRIDKAGVATATTRLPSLLPHLRGGVVLRHGDRPISPYSQFVLKNAFGGVLQGGASIGLAATWVLVSAYTGMLRAAGGYTTPWDDAPIMAMCDQGDLVAFGVGPRGLHRIQKLPLTNVQARPYDVLYVAKRHVAELARIANIEM